MHIFTMRVEEITDRCFQYALPHLWNKLPVSLREPVSLLYAYLNPSFSSPLSPSFACQNASFHMQEKAKSGVSNWRPAGRIRPATPYNPARDYPHRTLFTDLCFSVIFLCVLRIVHKLTICWTEPVICKYSTNVLAKHSRNQSFIFKNTRSFYWGSVPACKPKFYGNGVIPAKMLIPFDM